jgi:predicted phosphodiesterase
MDVNQDAVQAALSNADLLIHGHTHVPIFMISMGKRELYSVTGKKIPLRF